MSIYSFYVVRNIVSGFAIKDNYLGMYLDGSSIYKSFREAQDEADRLNEQVAAINKMAKEEVR